LIVFDHSGFNNFSFIIISGLESIDTLFSNARSGGQQGIHQISISIDIDDIETLSAFVAVSSSSEFFQKNALVEGKVDNKVGGETDGVILLKLG
jgi:hypothetical protein